MAQAGEAWVDAVFRGQRVKARASESGDLLVGPGGFVEFRYQVGGKSYKSRPESFERVVGAEVTRVASAPAAPTVVQPARAASASRSRVVGKAGHAKVVDLTQRRGSAVAVQLWTDGACSGNPGPAGLGVHAEHRGEAVEISEYLGEGTNNIAELSAILRALEVARARWPEAPLDVMTDSEYCLGLLGLGWKAKANQALVERLKTTYANCPDVMLVKVKGHAGVPGNERADELARQAITSRRSMTGPAKAIEEIH